MVYPLLPKFLFTVLGGDMTWLGTIDGTAESLSSLVKLWSGNRIDRGGRHKWFVVFGYGLAALTRPLAGVVQLPWQLFGVRVAERLGKGVHAAPRDAMIADSTAPEIRGRAFGFRQSMDHVGAAVGTLVAAGFLWLWPGALRTLFLLTLLPGIAVVALLWLGLRSPPAQVMATTAAAEGASAPGRLRPVRPKVPPLLAGLGRLYAGQFQRPLSLGAGQRTGHGQLAAAGPVVRVRRHERRRQHVLRPGGRSRRPAADDPAGLADLRRRSIWLSLLPRPRGIYGFLFLAYAFFYALTEPAEKTLVANLVGPERRGLAYGWYNAAIGIATLPASVLFGGLYDAFGAQAAFGAGAGLALLAAILLWRLCRPQPVTENLIRRPVNSPRF